MYGESQQASYLVAAKERNSETKSRRKLFNDRTNDAGATQADAPVSPFKDQSSKISSIRESSGSKIGGSSKPYGTENIYQPSSPVKSFDYRS